MSHLFMEGLVLQASLIFALGAQNVFVLESGLRRQNHLMVSLVCFLCDLALIMLGVAGAATLFAKFPQLKIMIGVVGVSFLFIYGLGKVFSSSEEKKEIPTCTLKKTLKQSIILSVTFSILNPHAYLDAFILIGGFATKYAAIEDRMILGLGAAFYSGVWFLILSTLSSVMKPILENPRRMKKVMSVAGCILIFLSAKLSIDVMDWIMVEYNTKLALQDFMNYPWPPAQVYTSILY